jgi:hypothetical protein
MKEKALFDSDTLLSSPMRHLSLAVPAVLLDRIKAAATADDPSAPNVSSWARRALIDRLKREAA